MARYANAERRDQFQRRAGYTLIELVTVLSLLGIIAAFAAPRFFDTQVFDARGYSDEVAAALRYAQKAAVGSGCRVRVRILASGYDAAQQPLAAGHCDSTSATYSTALVGADGQPIAGTAPSGVTASPALTVVFDSGGRAEAGANVPISVGGRTITVDAVTGYVDAS